jgi:hypothetical protein
VPDRFGYVTCPSSYFPVIHSVNLTQTVVRKIRCFRFLMAGFSVMSHLFGIGDSSSFLSVEADCECGNLLVFGVCKYVPCVLVII